MNVRLTLRTKLMVMLVAACAFVLGVACAAFVLSDRSSSGKSKERTMTVLADTIAGSAAGAVAFGDQQATTYVLEKLAAEDTALSAAVYGVDGVKLAGWERAKGHTLDAKRGSQQPTEQHALLLDRPVAAEGKPVGTLVLQVSTRDLDERTRQFLLIALGIFAACTCLATLASLRLHRFITDPVRELASTAAQVQSTKNYGLRATSRTNDELGLLTHAFNDMLQSVQTRDEELEQHRKNLSRLVDERTAELARRTREMRLVFDTVAQGFVTIDRQGQMSQERSSAFDAWFPANDERIFSGVLERQSPGFAARFQLGWDQLLDGFMPVDVAVDQLPSKLTVGSKTFELTYVPLLDQGELQGTLVAITDVTRLVEAAARQANERELVAAISRLIADRSSFVDFLEETERIVASLATEDRALVARGLHTIKGTCSLFGLEALASHCHHLEDDLEGSATLPEIHASIAERWSAFMARVKPFVGGNDERVTVTRAELHQIATRLESGLDSRSGARVLRRWFLEPTEPRLSLLAEQAKVLATRIGKPHVRFQVEDEGVRVQREPTARLWSVLAHLVRNALDHGIESPTERSADGKQPEATLTFRAKIDRGSTVLEFSDDGRGIDWSRVAKKAQLENPTHEQLVGVLFSDGFSTRDAATETSGRGVGLSAVGEVVQALGGRIEVESQRGRGTTFRLIIPETINALPAAA